jgi:hypothetical protein
MTHPVVYNIKVKRRGDQSDTNLKEIFCCISQLHVSAYKQSIISPTVKKKFKMLLLQGFEKSIESSYLSHLVQCPNYVQLLHFKPGGA